jgi:hypothetical protein
MEVLHSFETSVHVWTIWRYISVDGNISTAVRTSNPAKKVLGYFDDKLLRHKLVLNEKPMGQVSIFKFPGYETSPKHLDYFNMKLN